jgi:hypothetical protein
MDRKTELIGICATGILLFFLCLCILDFLSCILFIVGLSVSNMKIKYIITITSLGTILGASFCICCVISASMIAGTHEENRFSPRVNALLNQKKPEKTNSESEIP